MSGSQTLGAVSRQITSDISIPFTYGASLDTNGNAIEVNIMDYSVIDKFKTMITRANALTATDATITRWNGTAGINTIYVNPISDNWTINSVISLYGIEA